MMELAEIQLRYGFDTDAILMMRKAYDECSAAATEDKYTIARKIMLTSLQTGNYNHQMNFSDIAMKFNTKGSSVETGMLEILNAHAQGRNDLKLMARKFSSMNIIPVD